MLIKDQRIDNGTPFDWDRTSLDYTRFRDIYPQEFYKKVASLGLCTAGQRVLDLGTGTGVLPRNMYHYGAKWTATDISENQIEQAKRLSEGMDIDYLASPAEELSFPVGSFDVITACQCFWYFDHKTLAPLISRMLKHGGRFVPLCMNWLPFEDKTAYASEQLVLKYSPNWSGAGETLHPIDIPSCYYEFFELKYHEEYILPVHFTRESWNGRMKACRSIGASLSPEKIDEWEQEHMKLLIEIAPPEFDIRHFAAVAVLRKI